MMSAVGRKPSHVSSTVLLLMTVATCTLASAKCAYEQYTVQGTVNATTGEPVSGARITVTWQEGLGSRSETFLSGPNGDFTGSLSFYPFSGRTGLFGEDRCEAKLESAAVSLSARDFTPKTGTLTFTRGHARATYVMSRTPPVPMAFVVFRVPYDGNPSLWGNGTAVDENGQPLADVMLLRQDFVEVPLQGSHCGHVAAAKSNTHGAFFMSPWLNPAALGDRRNFLAYRAGYVFTGVSESGLKVSLQRDTRTAEERLGYLRSVVLSASCISDPSSDVLALLQNVVQEEERLATTEEQKKKYLQQAQEDLEFERGRFRRTSH